MSYVFQISQYLLHHFALQDDLMAKLRHVYTLPHGHMNKYLNFGSFCHYCSIKLICMVVVHV